MRFKFRFSEKRENDIKSINRDFSWLAYILNVMLKFTHLFKNYYLGVSVIGIIAFMIQEIPYIVMPLVKLVHNPIMHMQNEIEWIVTIQNILGVLTMALLMLIVRDDVGLFSLKTTKEKNFFALTVLMLLINFIGWTAYYLGYQYGWLIVISQFMAVPLYYLFYGVWKSNYPMIGTAALFLIFHTMNGFMNFVTQ